VVETSTASASRSNSVTTISTPRRRASASGPYTPGCSSSEVTILSPRPNPATTVAIPSVVQVVSATSSGAQPSRSA
jgi:hypothetical protein